MKPVKNEKNWSSTETNNKLKYRLKCFAGCTKFFCGPHVRHLWFRIITSKQQIFSVRSSPGPQIFK